MKSNTIQAENGIEVYEDQIMQLADEYIASLDNPDMIYNTTIFSGMIKSIYLKLFRPKDISKGSTNLDTNNIYLLDNIWSQYTALCYRFKKRPTILNYCVLTGIDKYTIYQWEKGITRKSNPLFSGTTKRWQSECESAVYDGAIDSNSVGCMFALKANYGYRETAPIVGEIVNQATATPQQIAERHAGATMPELPELD